MFAFVNGSFIGTGGVQRLQPIFTRMRIDGGEGPRDFTLVVGVFPCACTVKAVTTDGRTVTDKVLNGVFLIKAEGLLDFETVEARDLSDSLITSEPALDYEIPRPPTSGDPR